MSDQQFDNTNRGALFRNDRRENDRQAEYNGSINVDGVEYWVNAWIKEGKKGKFFSLSVKAKQEPRRDGHDDRETVKRFTDAAEKSFPGAKVTRDSRDDLDSDIPF